MASEQGLAMPACGAPWRVTAVPYPDEVAATVDAFAGAGEVVWLDGAARLGECADVETGGDAGRFSVVARSPVAVIEQHEGGRARLMVGGSLREEASSAWDLWEAVQGRLPGGALLPWRLSPGWIGYIGFEMGRFLERLPGSRREDLGLPMFRVGLFDEVIVLDGALRRAYAVVHPGVRPCFGLARCEGGVAAWADACAARRAWSVPAARLVEAVGRRRHESAVARAIEYIKAGDIYQVNLAQRLRLEGVLDPMAVAAVVRRRNPAAYAALLRWGERAVISASPELFLRVRGDAVLTRPIKGTCPHVGDEASDAVARAALLASEKEAAELAMIVDLHRNDLGRVCRYGSVRVAAARYLERHPTVYHTVADVVGRLAPHRGRLDLLRAAFPAGSITGVPKIRAMEIIDELELFARGAYTGTVCALGLDGQMTCNVAIRTLQQHRDVAHLYVGGGIVADSGPGAEYDETLAKARGILDALQCNACGDTLRGTT